jgi:hypothetical protein
MGFVKDRDIMAVTALQEDDGEEEDPGGDWDSIKL